MTGVYQSNGLYLAQYVPYLAGTYTLTITLLGIQIKDSPWEVEVIPGDIDASKSITTLGAAPITSVAGVTKFFTITTFDMYSNLQTTSYNDTNITIMATYVTNSQYASPLGLADLTGWDYIYGRDISGIVQDNFDGTYAAQITIYRAASFILSIKINEVDVVNSPYNNVAPSAYYGISPN